MVRNLTPQQRRKERVVLVLLTLIFASGIALLFLLTTGWVVVFVAAGAVAIALLALIHYAIWGRKAVPVQARADRGENPSRTNEPGYPR